ncbi:MAG: serine/threonine protein kinase, bacterial [Pyrinomonadaceae bacterium]|jgi:serine/threonine protein kinase|nr:serine/threonine protein kinase, bacterial [Pyrinomonadaceae bacterium]
MDALARMFNLERFIGEVLDGKYRLERLLGQGGMGAVYLATHLGTERPVALKLITPEFMRNDEFVERFKREARAAGRLRHPNVVDVTDFGFAQVGAQRVAYLVMEYLDGCTLGDVLAEESRLPLDWVVDILEQTCSAVDEAHQQGVVHRDLKPDNIWLEPNRFGGYRVKVLDFGIAKLADGTGDYAAAAADELPAAAGTTQEQPASQTGAQEEQQQSQLDVVQASIARAASSVGRGGSAGSGAAQGSSSQATSSQGASSHSGSSQQGSSEAATQLQLSVDESEGEQPQTLIFAPPSVRPSQQQQQQQSSPSPHDPTAVGQMPRATQADHDADQTRIFDQATAGRRQTNELQTAAAAGVTRVGAILGTPLYMSPEQCRGRRLDARSDIYSLGVIAYQMLTGETPFAGDMVAVMRQHMETPPPPLRERNRKVSKKVARQVMAALRKNPAERPASAAGFASALRGSSEGIGFLLTRAFALYSEHFPKFLRISLLAHAPVIAMVFVMLGFDAMQRAEVLPKWLTLVLAGVFGLLNVVVSFLSTSVITAMTALMVTQLHVAPMRPLSIRDALAVLKRRWRPFLRTSIRVTLTIIAGFALLIIPLIYMMMTGGKPTLTVVIGLALFVIPGIVMMIRYALYAPVVLMESLEKRAALKRANELSRRSRRTVIALLFIQLTLPFIMGAIVGFLSFKMKGGDLHINSGSKALGHFAPLFNIITVPLISITTALLYLKMRQLGGETFKETLEQFDNVEAPLSRWQERMRRRLTVGNTPVSRG